MSNNLHEYTQMIRICKCYCKLSLQTFEDGPKFAIDVGDINFVNLLRTESSYFEKNSS